MRTIAAVRLAVGVALVIAPKTLTRNQDPSFALLVRTIGIRDFILGVGALLAGSDADRAHWVRMGVASDALDSVAGASAVSAVGRRGGLTAALVPVPFAAAGLVALRRRAVV